MLHRDSGDKVWANSSPTGLRGGAGVEKGSDRSSVTSRPSAGRGGVGGRGKHTLSTNVIEYNCQSDKFLSHNYLRKLKIIRTAINRKKVVCFRRHFLI